MYNINKNSSLELLRIIACFSVIVNHTISILFNSITPSATWFLSLGYFFTSKIAVPVFIMISGYTLLHKNDSYSKTAKRILRILCVLILFSLLYYIDLYGISNFNIKEFFLTIISRHITNAFWYLYLYVGLLLMLPFLQKLVSVLSKKDFYVFFAISACIFMIYPIIVHYIPSLEYTTYFEAPLFGSYICLFLLGGYFKKYGFPQKIGRIPLLLLFIGICIFNVIMTFIEYNQNNGIDYLFYDNKTYFPIVLQSVCLFCFVHTFSFSGRTAKIINHFGKYTFAIYLLADYVLHKILPMYNKLCNLGIHPLFSMFVYEFSIFVICYIIAFVLKKIPILRKLL